MDLQLAEEVAVVVGAARGLGFAIAENFHFPYAAVGFSDFWRRGKAERRALSRLGMLGDGATHSRPVSSYHIPRVQPAMGTTVSSTSMPNAPVPRRHSAPPSRTAFSPSRSSAR